MAGSFFFLRRQASISFWISRRLYAEAAERRLRDVKMYHTLNMLLAEDQGKFTWRSLKIILLTRASPLFPFPLINYACGLTRVRGLNLTWA